MPSEAAAWTMMARKLSKRERAAIQRAQDLKQREGLGDGETGTNEEAARRFVGA